MMIQQSWKSQQRQQRSVLLLPVIKATAARYFSSGDPASSNDHNRSNLRNEVDSKRRSISQKSRQYQRGKHDQQNEQQELASTRPDAMAINVISKKLTLLLRRLAQGGYDNLTPVWQLFEQQEPDEEQKEIFSTTVDIVVILKRQLEQGVILPGTKHRHEFVVLTERILRIYSYCGGSGSQNQRLFHECERLLHLLQHYGLELTHKHCDAVVQVAARNGRWTKAAALYFNHIDPDASGYLPVTATAGMSTVTGLYCIARAARDAGTPPVENVLEGVLKLSLVSPVDSENCKLEQQNRVFDRTLEAQRLMYRIL